MALHVRHTDTRPAGFTVHSHTRTGTGRDDRAACCSPCRLAVGVCVYSRRRPAGPPFFFSRSRRSTTRRARALHGHSIDRSAGSSSPSRARLSARPASTAGAGRDHPGRTRAS